MKKLAFILAVSAVFVSSCKKTYTCTCTTISSIGGSTISTAYEIPNATQQEAATICVAKESYTSGNSQTVNCSL